MSCLGLVGRSGATAARLPPRRPFVTREERDQRVRLLSCPPARFAAARHQKEVAVIEHAPHPTSAIVIGGVDTHKEIHVAAVVDHRDVVIGTQVFSTTRAGYRALLRWMRSFGDVKRVGVECTGSYGAGVLRFLENAGLEVLEVTAPDRSVRRKKGKTDTLDAENAAHATFAGIRTVTPKTRDGMVESLRVLRVARKTAVAARRVALQMLRMQIISAPEELRDQVRNLTRMQLIRTIATWRPDASDYRDPTTATRMALRSLGRRYLELSDEIADLDVPIRALVEHLNPALLERTGVGVESAAQLLVTSGDNPERLRSEASFAALCGACPIPASSGMSVRHRLNRGGDRAANSALHMIVISRLRIDDTTKAYVQRRTAEGRSKLEIMRCLKRYVAREIYHLIKQRNTEINEINQLPRAA
jgi:transposase